MESILDMVRYLHVVQTFTPFLRLQSEMDQTFVSVIRIYMKWEDPHLHWDPDHFGGLDKMRVSADLLWKPDLMIKEMIEKNKAVPNPFITLHSNGTVEHVRELMVVSTCRMEVRRFPFDVQHCNLSLKSMVYPEEELKIEVLTDGERKWSETTLRDQIKWKFLTPGVTNRPVPECDQKQSVLIYSIRMNRRYPIFIANFLVPIMFLFCLDLASFLMPDQGCERVSFEITLLLAVTVMQLILNDVLPSSSDTIPLIVVFSIGMFCLMLISLLETILVMYLIKKDSASEESNADKGLSEDCGDQQGNNDGDVKKWTHCACKVSDEPPTELLSVAEEVRVGLICKMNVYLRFKNKENSN
ncbi:5-hydroxytryptamine receptor 3A-like isoform X1 [Notothenia coriiceps]|uniref:5-hydroxytryptamine receptor 3A-like isoform X1 n=1 Tax=Notothenia coriiceps TaxID=8208 RepID=A0A6I9N737_9TELE|nr:PREDICTED: 5-hydroxytryptamine receptor 3A-like isoform X1 [Notothenia coriiceps]